MDEEICNNMFYLYHYIFVHKILDLVISKGLFLAKYHLLLNQKVVCYYSIFVKMLMLKYSQHQV